MKHTNGLCSAGSRGADRAGEKVSYDAPQLLTAYPNPSDGKQPIYLVAHLLEGMTAAEVRVFDPLGRQILVERVNNAVGIAELPTDGLPTGLYSVVLLVDGLNVGSTKFEIIR